VTRHGDMPPAPEGGRHWVKIKNPAAPAVNREREEDWGSKRWARGRRRT
jgi:hypothetical protein